VPLLALALEQLEQFWERGIVGDDAERQAEVGDRRPDHVVVAHVGGGQYESALRRSGQDPARLAAIDRIDELHDLVRLNERYTHQFDEVGAIRPVGAQSQAPNPGMVRWQTQDMPEIAI